MSAPCNSNLNKAKKEGWKKEEKKKNFVFKLYFPSTDRYGIGCFVFRWTNATGMLY